MGHLGGDQSAAHAAPWVEVFSPHLSSTSGWEKEDRAKALAHEVRRAGEACVENWLAVGARVAKILGAKAVELAPATVELADRLEAHESGTAKVA